MQNELKSFEKLALEAIQKGGKFNGKIYTERNGKHFIYVSNQRFQILTPNLEYFKSLAVAPNATYNTGLGFYAKESERGRVNKLGFDAIEG